MQHARVSASRVTKRRLSGELTGISAYARNATKATGEPAGGGPVRGPSPIVGTLRLEGAKGRRDERGGTGPP